ncbi:MAG: PEFG-CTERM sorting domain-containing protein [Nitrosotalea sp.]
MSKSRNGVKASLFGMLGTLAIMTILMVPAYADPIVKPTSAGTLNISFETDPATPNPGDQTEFKVSFLNKQNAVQQHIDYRVSMTQGSNQVFGTEVTHTAEGSVSIPFQFQSAGTYQVTITVVGILFQPIPPETANFTVVVGPSVPEFGPLAGMIIAISITSVVIISKKTQLHI